MCMSPYVFHVQKLLRIFICITPVLLFPLYDIHFRLLDLLFRFSMRILQFISKAEVHQMVLSCEMTLSDKQEQCGVDEI